MRRIDRNSVADQQAHRCHELAPWRTVLPQQMWFHRREPKTLGERGGRPEDIELVRVSHRAGSRLGRQNSCAATDPAAS